MLPAVGAVTGVLNLSGAAGAPFVGVAAILLQDIVQTCDKVKIYKACVDTVEALLVVSKTTQFRNNPGNYAINALKSLIYLMTSH